MLAPREGAATTLRVSPAKIRHSSRIWLAQWGAGGTLLGLGAGVLGWGYGPDALVRFSMGYLVALLAQAAFIALIRRRIGPEASSLADWLTLGRASAAGLLAGLVASGVTNRLGPAGWLGFLALVVGASVMDWLDGPLARRLGATRMGAALDIEADSWMTLWASAAAIAWGTLPWVVIAAPLLHYLHPMRALWAGGVPRSDGVVWARVPGTAQMVLFAAALLPIEGDLRDTLLTWVAYPIAAAQTLTMLLTLRRRPI
jgi:phosphatidylglycerophosphate synthase